MKISSTTRVAHHIAKKSCFRSSMLLERLSVVNTFFHMCELNPYMRGIHSLLKLTVNNEGVQVVLGYRMCKEIKITVTK
jgi:hypothetical protein